ncbi:hypothetical protein Droror1_Dr00018130 [Drosera rotundifolia]
MVSLTGFTLTGCRRPLFAPPKLFPRAELPQAELPWATALLLPHCRKGWTSASEDNRGRLASDRTEGGLRLRAGEDWLEERAVIILESVGAGPGRFNRIVGSGTLLRIAPEAGQKRLAGRAGSIDLGERRRCAGKNHESSGLAERALVIEIRVILWREVI